MRLSNNPSVAVRKATRLSGTTIQRCYRISQPGVSIWPTNCRINCYISTSTPYCDLYIDWPPSYPPARHTPSVIARANTYLPTYLPARHRILLQQLLEHHLHYSPRYLTKTYAFASQIDASSPAPFRRLLNPFDIELFNSPAMNLSLLEFARQKPHELLPTSNPPAPPPPLENESWYWYKEQSETAKNISEWLEALATAKSPPKLSIQTPLSAPSAPPPPKHHTKPVEKEVVQAVGPRFNREGDRTSPTNTTTSPTPPTSPKTTTKFSISRPVTPPERPGNLPTPPVTPAAIAPTTPKRSRLSTPTPKPAPKRAETASVDCPLTPPATPRPRPRKSTSKPYLTIHDLVRMFRGKPRPFGLPQHQNRHPSPQSIGARQSRSSPTYQSRITAYFLPAANQKAPISQGLKSPNPRNFQQPTPAESIRPASALPEKSAFSPYKMAGISYTNRGSWQSRSSSRSSFAWPWPHTSPPLLGSPPPDPHVCCTCFGYSSFRNGLFDHPRPSLRYPPNRRPTGGMG